MIDFSDLTEADYYNAWQATRKHDKEEHARMKVSMEAQGLEFPYRRRYTYETLSDYKSHIDDAINKGNHIIAEHGDKADYVNVFMQDLYDEIKEASAHAE